MTFEANESQKPKALAGKHIVITGAASGVGRACAHALRKEGAHLLLLCRSHERALPLASELRSIASPADIELIACDLAKLEEVRSAANQISRDGRRIDVLLNNAATAGARGTTAEGFELAFGVNHLAHYLLTRLLLPHLSDQARIVHVASGSHRNVRALDFDGFVGRTKSRFGIREYAASKLASMLFHQELARRLVSSDQHSFAADPGDVASDAWRNIPQPFRALWTCRMQSPEAAAQTPLHAIRSNLDDAPNGTFFVNKKAAKPSALVEDQELALRLWNYSAEAVGLPS